MGATELCRREETSRHCLTIAAAVTCLALVRDFVAASAKALDMPDSDTYRFQLAAEEAVTNIIRHGQSAEPGEAATIGLEMNRTADGWTLVIRDAGRPFDPCSLPPPDLKSGLRRRKPGGLGVHLIRSMMDEVRYTSSAGQNALVLSRRRS